MCVNSGGGGRGGRSGGGGGSIQLSDYEQKKWDEERSYKNANKPIPEDQRQSTIRSLRSSQKVYDMGETLGTPKDKISHMKDLQNKIVNHPDLTMGQARTFRRATMKYDVIRKLAAELKIK